MRKYKYTAVNLQKETFKGTFIAKNEKDLALQLSKQSLFLVSATPYSDATPNAFFSVSGKVKTNELAVFCRQFAIMINSGIPILGCIEILKTQSYSGMLKKILDKVCEDVKAGLMLSEAIDKHKKVFPEFFRSMLKIGEMSGKMDMVLTSLADYYEKDLSIKKKVKGALAYPIMLLVLTLAIVVVMLAFIVPTFRTNLSALEVEPEGLTLAVYNLSDFMLANWLYILAVIGVTVCLLWGIGLTKKGRYFYDYLALHLPIVKKIKTDLITARFARGFALLLASGMDVVDAMDSISIVLGNKWLLERFKKAKEEVEHGMTLTTAFRMYKLFPEMLIQMVSIGEKTAALDEVLNRSCVFFDEQVETSLNAIVSKIQPIMLCIMGAVVAVLFMAVYSPMLSMMTQLA